MLDNFSIIIKDNCYRLALYLPNIIELSRRSVIIVHIAHPSQPVYNSISLAQSMYPQQQPMAALQTTTNKIQTGSSVTALVQLSQTKSLNSDAHLGMFWRCWYLVHRSLWSLIYTFEQQRPCVCVRLWICVFQLSCCGLSLNTGTEADCHRERL